MNRSKPTLAKVQVLLVCKDFGFGELIVQVFLKIFCFVFFFVCVELSWVGGKGGAPWTQEVGVRIVGASRVGVQTQKKWGPKGLAKSGGPPDGPEVAGVSHNNQRTPNVHI